MPLTADRIQSITVDADIGRPPVGYTEEELAFRREVEDEIREIHAKGGMVDFGPSEVEI